MKILSILVLTMLLSFSCSNEQVVETEEIKFESVQHAIEWVNSSRGIYSIECSGDNWVVITNNRNGQSSLYVDNGNGLVMETEYMTQAAISRQCDNEVIQ